MYIRDIPLQNLDRYRSTLLRFLKLYGENRVTHQALRWLRNVPSTFQHEGTLISVALDSHQRLIGVLAIGYYGLEESVIVVKPSVRTQGVGHALVKHALTKFKRLYARIATDNVPSLKLCFSNGFVAFDLFTGITGKPTFILGTGQWTREEALEWLGRRTQK